MSVDNQELLTHLDSLLGSARPALRTSVLPALTQAIIQISQTLQSSLNVKAEQTSNAFGDAQLNVDLATESIIRSAIAESCPSIVTASSEEDPVERRVQHTVSATGAPDSSNEQYTLAFDPLDGSSIISPNWTVGTILGLWDGASALHSDPATAQIAAIFGVYGPRTTIIVALRIPGFAATCFELGVARPDPSAASTSPTPATAAAAVLKVTRKSVHLAAPPFKTRYFAPANLRVAGEDARYSALVTRYIREGYSLRYCGGLVPDIVHALDKGHGVYVSPVTETAKAKLRRLFELLPVALIVECAGGAAVDPGTGESVLARAVADLEERGGLVCGTREEVEEAARALRA